MVDTIQSIERIPNTLLDEFLEELWFGTSHAHTYLRPQCVNLSTFKLRPQRFSLTEEALRREVESWPGVAYEVREGKPKYLFGALMPQD